MFHLLVVQDRRRLPAAPLGLDLIRAAGEFDRTCEMGPQPDGRRLSPAFTIGAAMDVRLKRAYEHAAAEDGYRVLVDRLWPRGVSKKRARLDAWEKELAPSTELREWFGHQPGRFPEFRRRYIDELRAKRTRLNALRRRAATGTLTLVYSAHDREHNDAVVLAEVLRRGLQRSEQPR